MKANIIDMSISLDGKLRITLETDRNEAEQIEEIKDSELQVEIKKYRKPRSLTANAYMWALLAELGRKLKMSKDDLYTQFISRTNYFRDAFILPDAIGYLKSIDNHVQVIQDEGIETEITIKGKTIKRWLAWVRIYLGSSHYDSQQMAELLDDVVEECKTQGVPTMPPDEVERLVSTWRGR